MATAQVDPFQTDSSGRRVKPSFSLAERDHRYARVREFMAERSLDCLLVPASDAETTQDNSRYLCQIGGHSGGAAWVVFPASGEATALVENNRVQAMWKSNLLWPTDIRWGTFSEMVPERVKELGLERSRIGVVGLTDLRAKPEGIIPYETWRRITAALPQAGFVSATQVLALARVVKSPEEIAVIQRVTDANEAAIRRMMEVATPGIEEWTVWLAMTEVLMRHTAGYPSRLSISSNSRRGNSSNGQPLPIAMEDGGILTEEIVARLQGYAAQSNHSILVGTRDADRYRDAMTASIEIFHELVGWIKPGKTVGQLMEEYTRCAEARGGTIGGVLIRASGLGDDRPRTGPVGPPGADHDMVIQPGWTFTIKTSPRISATGVSAQVGDPVTVTEQGARRLGHRELTPFITG